MDILAIYQFCTFGGVERMLLNRAAAFKNGGMDVVMSVGYLKDFGALDSFKKYIQGHGLEKYINPFLISNEANIDQSKYDLILVIDTPQILNKLVEYNDVFIECHTPYVENRRYLRHIPANIRGVIVPSKPFRRLVKKEYPLLPEILVLGHPVPVEFSKHQQSRNVFGKRPVTYLARIDDLKNFNEAVEIFQSIQDRSDVFQIAIGQGVTQPQWSELFKERQLLAGMYLRDSIPFDHVPALVNLVRQHRGVFLSPSKGESFGLSAAEFICGEVPILLSDIPVHRELVDNNQHFLYPLGDVNLAGRKLTRLLDEWDMMSEEVSLYREKFSYDVFISNWQHFLQHFGYLDQHSTSDEK